MVIAGISHPCYTYLFLARVGRGDESGVGDETSNGVSMGPAQKPIDPLLEHSHSGAMETSIIHGGLVSKTLLRDWYTLSVNNDEDWRSKQNDVSVSSV